MFKMVSVNNCDTFYIKEHILSGTFNSRIHNGLYKNKRVYIKKIPCLLQQPATIKEDIITVENIGSHKNLLLYFEGKILGQQVLLVMEPAMTNLRDSVINKNLSLPVSQIILQVCDGLKYLHDHDVVHGNLKPENVLISKSLIKLSDFGMKNIYMELSKTYIESGSFNGIVDWMAPELLQDYQDKPHQPCQGPESDIFSLGCVSYFTISNGNHHPFGSVLARATNILENKLTFNEEYIETNHRSLLPLIADMLSKETKKRPSPQIILAYLNLVYPDETVENCTQEMWYEISGKRFSLPNRKAGIFQRNLVKSSSFGDWVHIDRMELDVSGNV